MKKLFCVLIVMMLTTASLCAQCKITIKVNEVNNKVGKVFVALHNSAESFSAKGRYYKLTTIDISKGQTECTFSSVPEGKYAVIIFHDENGDNKLNVNAIGVPKEGYGFSNNVFGPMNSKPTFTMASFSVTKDKNVRKIITMKYRDAKPSK